MKCECPEFTCESLGLFDRKLNRRDPETKYPQQLGKVDITIQECEIFKRRLFNTIESKVDMVVKIKNE